MPVFEFDVRGGDEMAAMDVANELRMSVVGLQDI